uniref:Uncharacterized protein n=1 Tax=Picea sitchensis TaxID=3332 RepID=A9NLZ7_PICSI|nr:unknown [Picea sitchensis]
MEISFSRCTTMENGALQSEGSSTCCKRQISDRKRRLWSIGRSTGWRILNPCCQCYA